MPHYTEATEVEVIAKRLIAKSHPHKDKVNIGYLFRDKAPVSNNKVTYGMAIKVDDRNHVFNGRDAIIEISRDVWERLTDDLKDMLVDHELHHVGFTLNEQGTGIEQLANGRPAVFTLPHDFEDFEEILDRYPTGRKAMKAVTSAYLKDIATIAADRKKGGKGSGTTSAP